MSRPTSFEKHFVCSSGMRTICEVLREIYWATEDEVVREKAIEAEAMAKRMDAKLREYKKNWDRQGREECEWEMVENPEEIEAERRKKYEEQK